jgi:aryl sulfotransferase
LARQEEERGFNERPKTAERFFRKGEAGQWKQALSKRHIADIVAAHGPMMMRFGYVAEDCGMSFHALSRT